MITITCTGNVECIKFINFSLLLIQVPEGVKPAWPVVSIVFYPNVTDGGLPGDAGKANQLKHKITALQKYGNT